jgi:hypothetical protein
MDFAFFEGLTRDDAHEFLRTFLRVEGEGAREMLATATREAGLRSDFAIESISPLLRWATHKLSVVPIAAHPSLPSWIRGTDSYARALFDLDDPSNLLTLRCAFYVGESFVRSYKALAWSVGDPEIAEQNQPVVSGFRDGSEMSPLLVCQNLFRRVAVDAAPPEHIDRAVNFWAAKAQ